MSDLISRQAAMDAMNELPYGYRGIVWDILNGLPSAEPQRWIPVSERLPENTYPVNITWVNHKPESYYANIKDKPFTSTGCFCDGKWYWYSVMCQDYLDEYRYCDVDSMDDEIEVIAWCELPEPYKGGAE